MGNNKHKFIFRETNDNKGNVYHGCYAKTPTQANIVLDKKNICFKGTPQIKIRRGEDSVYKDELLFAFLINEKVSEYDCNSPYQTIEYYLPLELGIEFLEESLEYLKMQKELNEVNEEKKIIIEKNGELKKWLN